MRKAMNRGDLESRLKKLESEGREYRMITEDKVRKIVLDTFGSGETTSGTELHAALLKAGVNISLSPVMRWTRALFGAYKGRGRPSNVELPGDAGDTAC